MEETVNSNIEFLLTMLNNLTTMCTLKDFKTYLINQPDATVDGIYGKSMKLLGKNNTVVLAPGYDKKARMLEPII